MYRQGTPSAAFVDIAPSSFWHWADFYRATSYTLSRELVYNVISFGVSSF